MPVNLSTALIIQHNDIQCFAIGPFPNNKYGSAGYLMYKNMATNVVISIQEGKFDTCKEAIDALEDAIRDVRELELPEQENELENIL